VPIDDEGNPGDASNTTEVSAAPPPPVRILSVNPLGGVTGTEVTFGAVISGEAPFDYEWNFGGGAEPNESTEASPTVTLGAVDTYDAQLSVENEEGSAVKHFTLTVTAEPGEPPQIISVSPTEGDSGTVVTFTAEVTGDGPFTYYWDFAGGASPNQSSGVSGQPSATVTLTRGGTLPEPVRTYPASLTVTNSFGMTTHDFALDVSACWHIEYLPAYGEPGHWWSIRSITLAPDNKLWGVVSYNETPDIPGDHSVRVIYLDPFSHDRWITDLMKPDIDVWKELSQATDSRGCSAFSYGLREGGLSITGELHFSRKEAGVWTDQLIDPGGIALKSQLFFDSQDRAVIAYSYIGVNLKIARETADGWDIIDHPLGTEATLTEVALDNEDRIVLVCSYADETEMRLLRETSDGWEDKLIAEVQGEHHIAAYGIAIDSMNLARILYYGGTLAERQVARELAAGGWEISTVEPYPEEVSFRKKLFVLGSDDLEIIYLLRDYDEEEDWLLWREEQEWEGQALPSNVRGTLALGPEGYPVFIDGTSALSSYW